MAERHANLGYLALKAQSSPLTVAGTPDFYVPFYSGGIRTNPNFVRDNPIAGNKFNAFQTVRGQRGHTGSIQVMGEPNTLAHIYNMFMTRGSQSGSDPYTNPYTFSKTTDPVLYTADISYVSHVVRYIGMGVSSIDNTYEENEYRPNIEVSCLKVWDGREIASISDQAITFVQDYDRSPTTGLVAGDTLQIYDVSAGSYIDCTVSTIDSTTAITVTGTISSAGAGDFVTIKPQSSPSFSILPPFTWGNTEFRFGATAAAALSATHTPLEDGTTLVMSHPFTDAEGAKRSGSNDPAALPRMQGGYEFTPRKYFDTPEDLQAYVQMDKRACVIRQFSYSGGNTYEHRRTLNNLTLDNPQPNASSEEILYSEMTAHGNYDSSDAQGAGVTIISGVTFS